MDHPKYSNFNIIKTAYKTVNEQDIHAYIIIPKSIPTGKRPVIVNFHGGFFITGSALYPDWFPQWAIDYSLLHSALIISAEYRLLPESTGHDLYSDIADFWTWLRSLALSNILPTTIQPDLNKVIAWGGSAGGTIALHSGFTQPPGTIKAVIAAYPGMAVGAKRAKPILNAPPIPEIVLDTHLKNMVPGKIVTSADPPARLDIAVSLVQQTKQIDYYGHEERFFPMKLIDLVKEGERDKLPYFFVFHGREDSAVPVETSVLFVEKARERLGERSVGLVIEKGEHGFDEKVGLDTEWIREGLVKVTGAWLGNE